MTPTLTELTLAAFSENGILSKYLPHYRPNPVQVQYAETVAALLASGSKQQTAVGLVEAGTGIGKTLGYAVPLLLYAALTGHRVAISTYTVQLQSQILGIGGDLAIALQVALDLTGKKLVVAPRLGLRNFVSPARARQRLLEKGVALDAAPETVKDFLHWADTSPTGLLMDWQSARGELPVELSSADVCCEAYLPDTEKSRYLAHRLAAKEADVIVTNHALTLLHATSKSYAVLDDAESRPLSVIVADEADKVEAAAHLIANKAACLNTMARLFAKPTATANPAIFAGIRTLMDRAMTMDTTHTTHTALSESPFIAGQIGHDIATLLPLLDAAIKVCQDREHRAEIQLHRDALATFASGMGQPASHSIPVIHYSKQRRYPSLRLVNPNPGTVFGRLWQDREEEGGNAYLAAALLTSATLSDGNESSLKAVANTLGLFRSKRHQLVTRIFEPDDFGKLSLVLPDDNAPTPTLPLGDDAFSSDPLWVHYVSAMIVKAAGSGGRVLALTLSYRDTEMIADHIRKHHPDLATLIQQTETDSLNGLILRFKQTEGAVLLSPVCWEGINLPGLVKNVVVTRIPFSPPDSAIEALLAESMFKRGFSAETVRATVYGMSVIHTRRKLRQAIGRGIRQKTDVTKIWFGDRRILAQNGKLKLESLLPARFVPAISRAETFTLDGIESLPINTKAAQTNPWVMKECYL